MNKKKTIAKTENMKMTRTVFNISTESLYELKAQALKEGRPMGEILRQLVNEYLEKIRR